MEQSATLTVARRTWERTISRHNTTILPNRPCEGDLLYFPLTKGLFEIKFVEHQDPFYQLKKLYVYRLQVELFQYASERMETGVAEIDVFETLKTTDVDKQNDIDLVQSYGDNNEFMTQREHYVFSTSNPFGEVQSVSYTSDNSIIHVDTNQTTTDRA